MFSCYLNGTILVTQLFENLQQRQKCQPSKLLYRPSIDPKSEFDSEVAKFSALVPVTFLPNDSLNMNAIKCNIILSIETAIDVFCLTDIALEIVAF